MAIDKARTALALGDDFIFLEELIGGLAERLLSLEQTGAILAA